MTAYANDPRVVGSLKDRSFLVNIDGTPDFFFWKAVVRLADDDRTWVAMTLDERTNHASADEAIRSLIGDPQ